MTVPALARVGIVAVGLWLVVDLGLPLLSMWTSGAPRPVALPGFARALYLVLLLAGVLVYLSASDARLADTRAAMRWLFADAPTHGRGTRLARRVILAVIPIVVAFLVWRALTPHEATPTSLRTQHPTLPSQWEALKNPIRERDEAARRAALADGRDLFQIACRPCHGAGADGQGPMARGFRLKPADFTDPGTIATVVEPYAFWRVTEGGPGLPPEATPWESAMPVWKHDLDDAARWKAVLAAYDIAGVEPRKPEGTSSASPPPSVAAPADDRDLGKRVYVARCAACHGERGDGKGPVAPYVHPDPRDFTAGVYKLRTTESGQPPTDDDLLRVLARGIPGTAMPAWSQLPDRERRAVVDYVKQFGDAFKTKATAIPTTKPVSASATIVARGREVYASAKCWECHGDAGRADGPSAATLKDDDGDPVTPANLTKGWRLKGGRDAADIFMRLTTGMDGSPMPSYADTLPEPDRWALAHYVRSLQTDVAAGVVLRARTVAGDVPKTADDPRWRDAPPLLVPLAGQVLVRPRWQNAAIDAVVARAVFNERDIALLLEWDDATRDTTHTDAGPPKTGRAGYVLADESERGVKLRDALRVQLARPGVDRPHFLLGGRGRPVLLWHWRADAGAVTVERAEGPETPPTEARGAAPVESRAEWKDGRWRLVLVRRLSSDAAGDVALTRGTLIPFALHAWDGGRGERDLIMSLSSWTFLSLEPPPSFLAPLAGLMALALVAGGEWWLTIVAARPRPQPAR